MEQGTKICRRESKGKMTADEFRKLRKQLGISLRDLSVFFRMGQYSWSNISRWENGTTKVPGWAALLIEIMTSREIPDIEAFKRDQIAKRALKAQRGTENDKQ